VNQSFTYYLTLLVIKLKGLKKSYSQDPIDYKKIRKEDVHEPKGAFFKKNILRRFEILESKITEIGVHPESENLLIFIPGGAFISGPAQHHWDSVKVIAQQTNFKIWLCDYPKAPEHKIGKISENIDLIYTKALETFRPDNIILIGDSAGGALVTTLVQRLVKKSLQLPRKLIAISPVMDASMTNPEIENLDKIDPILSLPGVLSAKRMCVDKGNLKDEMISPLHGSFEKFPETTLFLAEHDIMYPDQKLAVKKIEKSNVNLKVFVGSGMPHIWPLLPVMKEAKESLKEIIGIINS